MEPRIRKILIVDDAKDSRILARRILEAAGFEVVEDASVDGAAARLQEDHPHAILLDLRMEGRDGFDLLRVRRQSKALSAIPVLVLSGAGDQDSVLAALSLGANDFLLKPINAKLLLMRLKRQLREKDFLRCDIEQRKETAKLTVPASLVRISDSHISINAPVRFQPGSNIELLSALFSEQNFGGLVWNVGDMSAVPAGAGLYRATLNAVGTRETLKKRLNDLGLAPNAAKISASEQMNPAKSPRAGVFVLDDDLTFNAVVRAVLKKFGVTCTAFSTREDLFRALETNTPGLLMLDLNVNGTRDGLEVLRECRERSGKAFPVVIISGESNPSIMAHALESGAVDYLVKPFTHDVLATRLMQHFDSVQLNNARLGLKPDIELEHEMSISFPVEMKSVDEGRLSFFSKHLVAKGSVIQIGGPLIGEILGSSAPALVTVTSSSLHGQRFLLEAEPDNSNTDIMRNLRTWIAKTNGN